MQQGVAARLRLSPSICSICAAGETNPVFFFFIWNELADGCELDLYSLWMQHANLASWLS